MRLASIVMLLMALGQSACSKSVAGQPGNSAAARALVPASVFDQMASKRFFFGHRSVGLNIVEGVQDILSATPGAALRVEETRDPARLQPGVLAHAEIGRNGDPYSKMAAFRLNLNEGIGDKADVALFKMCYLDITESTDVAQVFGRYTALIDDIRARYPALRLVHVTVPLQQVQAGPKAWIKQLIGRLPDAYAADERREQYNAMLRARYAGREPLFDLATLEATSPDGRLNTFTIGGHTVMALAPESAEDEGHLNAIGKRAIAAKFLSVLADTAMSPQLSAASGAPHAAAMSH